MHVDYRMKVDPLKDIDEIGGRIYLMKPAGGKKLFINWILLASGLYASGNLPPNLRKQAVEFADPRYTGDFEMWCEIADRMEI